MHIARQQLKNAMLPIAMLGGAIFYKWLGYLTFLSPFFIFAMLFITYCKLEPKDIKPTKEHIILLIVQMLLASIVYLILLPFSHILGEGIFICVFIPTATAAPVITSMLGGKISFVATYSLLSNAVVAMIGPVVLAAIGDNNNITILQSAIIICSKVFPLLICPLLLAIILRKLLPKLHKQIKEHQQLSFYLWAVSLFIIVGSCVSFTINNWHEQQLPLIIGLVAGALVVCLMQFWIGRKIGIKFGDKVSAGQSLGQKNTVLAVWIAMTYMDPIASIAPAAYILWQNIVNSSQIVKHNSKTQ